MQNAVFAVEVLKSRHLSQKSHKKTIAKLIKLCYKNQYRTEENVKNKSENRRFSQREEFF